MTDAQAIKYWEQFKQNLLRQTAVTIKENKTQQLKRIEKLKKNPEEFFRYYFANLYKAEPADFHKKATKRIVNNNDWYEVRAWARELAKSTRALMEILYLALNSRIRFVLLVSHSLDQATFLLQRYKLTLEYNERIIHDFGKQIGPIWTDTNFKTSSGVQFVALGAGQSPRGLINEDARPDVIIFDDIDTDEEVRNPTRIQKKWEWIEQAVMPTVSVSGNKRILFLGNIIGKDTCITRAMKYADYAEIINIRDKNGKSTWPAKNPEHLIDRWLSKISYASAQKEYFNNPIQQGAVFKELNWKKLPAISRYQFLVCYTDPSFKDSRKNDYKATVLVGYINGEYHIIKGFCEQTSTRNMVKWHYQIKDFVGNKTSIYFFMEANMIQDIILDEFDKYARENNIEPIPIIPDRRKKPDKFTRIESLLEPLNSRQKLWFNLAEKDNPHMMRIEEQFRAFAPGSNAHDDAPDAVEGAIYIINTKLRTSKPIIVANKRKSKKHW